MWVDALSNDLCSFSLSIEIFTDIYEWFYVLYTPCTQQLMHAKYRDKKINFSEKSEWKDGFTLKICLDGILSCEI